MSGLTSIILVTYNQLEFTKLCVESIERHTVEPYELIVVDNGSTDGTVEYAKEVGSQCSVFRQKAGAGDRGGK